MSVAFLIAWALTTAAAPAPAPEPAPGVEIIVVEVPASSRQTPTPTANPTPASTPVASVSPHPGAQGQLPATGWDAITLAIASALGVAALAAGVAIRRARRRRA